MAPGFQLRDLLSPERQRDPYPLYAELLAAEARQDPERLEHRVLTTHADVTRALRDGRLSSDRVPAMLAALPDRSGRARCGAGRGSATAIALRRSAGAHPSPPTGAAGLHPPDRRQPSAHGGKGGRGAGGGADPCDGRRRRGRSRVDRGRAAASHRAHGGDRRAAGAPGGLQALGRLPGLLRRDRRPHRRACGRAARRRGRGDRVPPRAEAPAARRAGGRPVQRAGGGGGGRRRAGRAGVGGQLRLPAHRRPRDGDQPAGQRGGHPC